MFKINILAIFILVLAGSFLYAGSIQFTVAYEDKEQPPYVLGNSSEVPDKPGVIVEIVQMLSDEIEGLEVILVRKPWVRCLNELEANKIDGLFNPSYKKSRLRLGWYPTKDGTLSGPVDASRRIVVINYSFYKRSDTVLKWDGNVVTGLNGAIAAPFGYSIGNDLRGRGYDVQESNTSMGVLMMLFAKRVDLAALQDCTADNIIKSAHRFERVEKMSPPIVNKPTYLMLSHQFVSTYPEVSKKIWDALKKIREAKFDELITKYYE